MRYTTFARVVCTGLAVSIIVILLAPRAVDADSVSAFQVDRELCYSLDNYYGQNYAKRCFPSSWKELFAGSSRSYFADEKASFERAMTNGKGDVAVINHNRNRGDNSSNAYFITVYWVEDNTNGASRIRFSADQTKLYMSSGGNQLHSAEIAPSNIIQKTIMKTPSYLWGKSTESGFSVSGTGDARVFFSTFPVDYPAGYDGPQVPDEEPDVPYESAFDYSHAFMIDKGLCYGITNYYGKNLEKKCYANSWRDLFTQTGTKKRSYFDAEKASFERAVMNGKGAWAVTNSNVDNGNNTSHGYFVDVYWVEDNSSGEAKFRFSYDGDAMYLSLGRTQELHSATIASPYLIQNFSSRAPVYLWGVADSTSIRLNGVSGKRLFQTTFPVEYPEHYNGPKVPGPPESEVDYLALGDSFSSGEGDFVASAQANHARFLPWTDEAGYPQEMCHVSYNSYPFRLQASYGVSSDLMRSVACSGAVTPDIYRYANPLLKNDDTYHGQDDRLANFSDEMSYQDAALTEFIPGRIEQIKFVEKYQPKVLTIGIGGNDVGFSKVIIECVQDSGYECPYATEDNEDRQRLARLIRGEFYTLRDLYIKLRLASLGTKIYVIGYPQLIDDDRSPCLLNAGYANSNERHFINEATHLMNLVIKSAATAAGVQYVDIEDSLDGGKLCEGIFTDYVTGIRSERWIQAMGYNSLNMHLYHPNAAGHKQMAAAIQASIGGNLYGTNQDVDASIGPPAYTDYFSGAASTTMITQPTSTLDTHILSQGESVESISAPLSYKSNEAVSVTRFSTPEHLGEFHANADGSLKFSMTIPADFPVGYHSLVFQGLSSDGDFVEYVENFFVKGSDTNDIDDDGIADVIDACLFVTPSGSDHDHDGIDDACDDVIEKPLDVPDELQETTSPGAKQATVVGASSDDTSIGLLLQNASSSSTFASSQPNVDEIVQTPADANVLSDETVNSSEASDDTAISYFVFAAVGAILALLVSIKLIRYVRS